MGESGFIKLLSSDIQSILLSTPSFIRYEYNHEENHDYPIMDLCGYTLNMLHYYDNDAAISEWCNRCKRLNWDNVFYTMYTDNEEVAAIFDSLPYPKKAYFTTFDSSLDSAFPPIGAEFINQKANERVNHIGWGHIASPYNLWDMLLYGIKSPV